MFFVYKPEDTVVRSYSDVTKCYFIIVLLMMVHCRLTPCMVYNTMYSDMPNLSSIEQYSYF